MGVPGRGWGERSYETSCFMPIWHRILSRRREKEAKSFENAWWWDTRAGSNCQSWLKLDCLKITNNHVRRPLTIQSTKFLIINQPVFFQQKIPFKDYKVGETKQCMSIWGKWSEWSLCDPDCREGKRKRVRTCLKPEVCGYEDGWEEGWCDFTMCDKDGNPTRAPTTVPLTTTSPPITESSTTPQTTMPPITSATKPDWTKPTSTEPEITKPDLTKPTSTKPEWTKPVTTPHVTKPESTKPESTKPESTKPDFTKPVSTRPDYTKPEVTSDKPVTKPATTPKVTETPISTTLESTKPLSSTTTQDMDTTLFNRILFSVQ